MSEMSRILKIPVREPYDLDAYDGPDMTNKIVRKGSDWRLRPVQSWALDEIRTHKGGILPIGVGGGKTLIAYAAPVVLGIAPEDVLVLVPASLRATFEREGRKYAAECRTPESLPLLSYHELSRATGQSYLADHKPKLIICDEAHKLRSWKSTRTKRFLRYLKAHPDTILVAMSGTLFSTSIRDPKAMLIHALGEGAPIPHAYRTTETWATCIDHSDGWRHAARPSDYRALSRLTAAFGTGKVMDLPPSERKAECRAAFHRRLITTPGIVYTQESAAKEALTFQKIDPMSRCARGLAVVGPMMQEVEETWTRPDGAELEDDLRVGMALKMLSLGFYTTWDWGKAGKDEQWYRARLAYHRAVFGALKRAKPGLDSPYLLEQGIRRTLLKRAGVTLEGPTLTHRHDELIDLFRAWDIIKDRARPSTKAVIVTTQIIDRVVTFATRHVKRRGTRGIIWYRHEGSAEILRRLGIKVHARGEEPEDDIPKKGTLVGMSIQSHGTGKNLQAWSDSFILTPPASGETMEQLVGRTHRPGQVSDEVCIFLCAHTPGHAKAIAAAKKKARFIQDVQGQKQKMCDGKWKKGILKV